MKIIKILLITLISVNLCYSAHQKIDKRLMNASKSADTQLVQQLLKDKSIDINAKDEDGFTALMRASNYNRKEIVKLLLNHPKINVNIQNNNGETAFIRASNYGHKEIVVLLLNHPKIDVNIKINDGYTALIWSSPNQRKEIAELLETYQNEYLPNKEKRIEELKKINEDLPTLLPSSTFPKVLVGIIQEYAANDFMTFSQWLEQDNLKQNQKESNNKEANTKN